MINKIKVLFISQTDILGRAFNGYDLHRKLNETELFKADMIVTQKMSKDKTVHTIFPGYIYFKGLIRRIEDRLSIQCWLYPAPILLLFNPLFWKADVVHYHLIDRWFSLLALPILTRLKPSVITLFNPYYSTGHCIHPSIHSCNKWLVGCHNCKNLSQQWSLKRDTSHLLWKVKKWVFNNSNLIINPTSDWMNNKLNNCSIMNSNPINLIYLGVDTDKFKLKQPKKSNKIIKIAYRNSDCYDVHKNSEFIDRILFYTQFNKKIKFVKIQDMTQDEVIKTLQSCDIFLAPSRAETFGMMIAESLSCGTPCIVLKDTATHNNFVINNFYGVAVDDNDVIAVRAYINKICNMSVKDINDMSVDCSQFIKYNFSFIKYIDEHKRLYLKIKDKGIEKLS